MTKLLYLSLITLSVLIAQVHAISFLNNLTLPNDILSKVFFDHIQHKNLSSTTELKDSEKCTLALKEIINRVPSLSVLPFIDAWGQIPSGLLYGHWKDLGNFDECIDISTHLSEPIGLTNGKYCFASLSLIEDQTSKPWAEDESSFPKGFGNLAMISIGICVPDFCDADFLAEVFKEAAIDVFNGKFKDVIVDNCMTDKFSSFEVIDFVAIIIYSTVGLMMLLSTLYDIYTDKFDKEGGRKEIFLAFSIISNGRKLFKISNYKSDNSITCLSGIRVLSMIWVMFCHCYIMTSLLPLINSFDFLPWFKTAFSLNVLMGTISVDVFFFISGLLIAWLGLRELDKSNGKLNISLMYIHRCMRLTPPLAAVIIFIVTFDKFIGIGPLKETFRGFVGNCNGKWWSTLLYIQNYTNPMEICMPQTWYLAVDTQLYFLSPLVLIPLWKWGKKFVPIMFLLSFLSISYVFAIYLYYGFNNFMGILEDDQNILTYTPTHARYSVWLVGIGLGYFMHTIKNKSIRLSKPFQILGWGVCFALILAVLYGPYFTINAERETSVLEAAMYEALRRVTWGVALSWLVFACHFGYGGFINSFLSHEMWQPISRLTYAIFLVHVHIIFINFGVTKSDVYFSDYSTILLFWSTFGISLLAAIVLSLAFEAPIFVIEKSIFRTAHQGLDQKTKMTSKIQLQKFQKNPL